MFIPDQIEIMTNLYHISSINNLVLKFFFDVIDQSMTKEFSIKDFLISFFNKIHLE